MTRISLSVKSQGTKKMEVFSQGTDDSKNWRCETLYIADYEHINITSSTVLDIKLFNRRLKIDTKCCHLLAITLYPTNQTRKCLYIHNQQ